MACHEVDNCLLDLGAGNHVYALGAYAPSTPRIGLTNMCAVLARDQW